MADNRSFESTLHDIVYSIDTGTGLKIVRVGLYFLILLVVVMVYTATQFRGLNSEEAMDYAQLGRNFSLQNGLVTKCVRPVSMWKMSTVNPDGNPQVFGHPDLYHPPAYPFLLATGFKLFDLIGIDPFTTGEGGRGVSMHAEQWIILAMNHLFSILTGLLVFRLGKRLFSREIGFLGMTIYYLSDLVWSDSISGLNISMAVFFVMASFYSMIIAMLNKRDGESKRHWVIPYLLSIVYSVIAFHTRYLAIAVVPGLCLFAWLMSGRLRGGTRFVVVFIFLYSLMISPWLVRNYRACGNPVGMVGYSALADSPKYAENSLARDLNPAVSVSGGFDVVKEKWLLRFSGEDSAILASTGGGILMAFFIVTFFYHFVRPQVNHLRWSIAVSLLLTILIGGFFSDSSLNMIHAYWPFIILYSLAFFYILIDRLDLGVRLYNLGLKLLMVLLGTIPFWMTLLPPHANTTYPPYFVPAIARVSELLNPREVMCTDMPWATAWYGDRVSILLPKDLEQFYEINDYKQYISGLYMTTITKNKPFVRGLLTGPEQSWLPVMSGRTPTDFPLKHGTAIIQQDQLFLTDRDRMGTGTGGAQAQ
jgi:4-amino-4-deoxy-L-arabinose transferase-like glycosyltransferase